MALGLSGLGEG